MSDNIQKKGLPPTDAEFIAAAQAYCRSVIDGAEPELPSDRMYSAHLLRQVVGIASRACVCGEDHGNYVHDPADDSFKHDFRAQENIGCISVKLRASNVRLW